MKCIILAAGYATRLYPLTENFPKPLLRVGGKTILDWIVDDIEEKVSEFVVISNGKFVKYFTEWAEMKRQNITVLSDGTFSNDTRLGAVRDIEFAVKELDIREDSLVIAGDNLLEFSLGRFIDFAEESGTSCIMRYFEPDNEKMKSFGSVICENGVVKEMHEKSPEPKSNWCAPAFYYLTKDDLRSVSEAISGGVKTDAPGSFIAWVVAHSTVHAFDMPGKRFDIGTLETYNKIREEYKGYVK